MASKLLYPLIISLLCIFLLVGGCSTYRITPDISEVPPGDAMAIDGLWKNKDGFVFRIEKGRSYTTIELPDGLGPNRVIIKDIQKTSPGHYEAQQESYNEIKRMSAFGPAQIDIVSADRIRIHALSNPLTGYIEVDSDYEIWTAHALDNKQLYLTEVESKKMEGRKNYRLIKKSSMLMKQEGETMSIQTSFEGIGDFATMEECQYEIKKQMDSNASKESGYDCKRIAADGLLNINDFLW